jgi:hypothetical protein
MKNMNLDEEMKLWEERANDEFGQILTKIKKTTKDYLYSWTEMGIESNALSEYITGYSLDGNRKYTAKAIYNILYTHDILGNHRNIKKLVNEMMKLADI